MVRWPQCDACLLHCCHGRARSGGRYVLAGHLQEEIIRVEAFNKHCGPAAVEQRRNQMQEAAGKGDYVLAGHLQVEIKRLDEIHLALTEGNYDRAEALQKEMIDFEGDRQEKPSLGRNKAENDANAAFEVLKADREVIIRIAKEELAEREAATNSQKSNRKEGEERAGRQRMKKVSRKPSGRTSNSPKRSTSKRGATCKNKDKARSQAEALTSITDSTKESQTCADEGRETVTEPEAAAATAKLRVRPSARNLASTRNMVQSGFDDASGAGYAIPHNLSMPVKVEQTEQGGLAGHRTDRNMAEEQSSQRAPRRGLERGESFSGRSMRAANPAGRPGLQRGASFSVRTQTHSHAQGGLIRQGSARSVVKEQADPVRQIVSRPRLERGESFSGRSTKAAQPPGRPLLQRGMSFSVIT